MNPFKFRLENQKPVLDKKLFIVTLILVFVGLVAVADASAPQALNIFKDKFHFVKDQLIWASVGFIALLITAKINYRFWEKWATPLFVIALLTLVLVLIPGIGMKTLGARRWIYLGPVFFQPSELAKFALVIFLAKLIEKKPPGIHYFLPFLICVFLIMLEPDFGTTLIITVAALIPIFASGVNLFLFSALGFTGLIGAFFLITFSPYRRERFLTFFETTRDPLGHSYHIRQILLGLGSGGFWGVGLGESRQKFLFLPEAANDSIFAVIAEEIGFFGSLILIGVMIYYLFRVFRIAKYAPDRFSQILALGILGWIGGQILLNLGSMTALVPLTGIPLPFISYGGSSLVTVMAATGILLNISQHLNYGRRRK